MDRNALCIYLKNVRDLELAEYFSIANYLKQ